MQLVFRLLSFFIPGGMSDGSRWSLQRSAPPETSITPGQR
ncbi:hypothetical protein RISK_004112 [Rhodopirellula islandica]|uniref:Uncharacterized protein n=1 Tax=Rhodopirellula islandica TaxID=595434 RepID=A0A0J1BAF5_RHOIS|nr:hypothetical protein RISK_004112 [Rhodopirellula islandica]